MRQLAERASHAVCLTVGRVLRAARYSKARVVTENGERRIRKERLFYATPLIALSRPFVDLLDTGICILPQREWENRERLIYQRLYGLTARADADGTLVLPCLPGETLAALLGRPGIGDPVRHNAVELAAVALADLHGNGFTHGDAMAENVMVDLDGSVARWFDFETEHDARRPMQWRRADDVRALLATCLLHVRAESCAETVDVILRAYGDKAIAAVVAESFRTTLQRRLVFHLGQAPLSLDRYRDIHRLLVCRSERDHSDRSDKT